MSQVSPDAIERLLSRRGYRLTLPRRHLLEVMASLGDHFVAESVVTATPEVGRATVFRTLRLHHHHVLCVDCGAAEDFSSPALESVLREVEESTGFTVEAHRLELYGRCPACRASSN